MTGVIAANLFWSRLHWVAQDSGLRIPRVPLYMPSSNHFAIWRRFHLIARQETDPNRKRSYNILLTALDLSLGWSLLGFIVFLFSIATH